jgi:hypothetical protein
VIQLEVTRERDIASFYADLKKYQLQIAALKRQLRNVGNYSTNLVLPSTALSRSLCVSLSGLIGARAHGGACGRIGDRKAVSEAWRVAESSSGH